MDKKTEGDEVKRFAIKTTEFPKPKSYNDFITEIANYFLIRRKKDIILKCITNDGDEVEINNQEDLDDNIDDIKEFQVLSESGYEEPTKSKEKPSINTENDPSKKDNESTGGDDDDEYKINLNVNIDIKDEEIEKIINSQIKEISIDENLNDVIEFDSDKYKDDLKKNTENIITKFQNEFDVKIKEIYSQRTTVLKTNFKKAMDNYSKSQIDIISKLSNDAKSLYDGLGNMVNDTEEMNKVMVDLKDKFEGNSGIILNEKNPKKVIKQPDRNDQFAGTNMIMNEGEDLDEEEDKNKLAVKFLKEVIKIDVLDTKCQYITVDDIKIENNGNKILKNLYFIRDEKQSSEDFIINQTKKHNSHKLTNCGDDFKPGSVETHSITLKINNPKPETQYKLYLYVRKEENGENLSKPLEIICNVNEDEEEKIRKKEAEEKERQRREQEKEKERQEQEKQERLRQEQEKERQRQEQEKQERLRQEQEKERQRQEQERKKQQASNDNSNNANENYDYQGLNPEEVHILAQELDDEFNIFSIKNKEEVINKIIEYKCDREKMNEWIEENM